MSQCALFMTRVLGVLARSQCASLRMNALFLALFFLPVALSCQAYGAEDAREGSVLLSNGERIFGTIRLSGDRTLRVQSEGKLLSLHLDQVKMVRIASTKEEMAQKWFFPEDGNAEKEFVVVPYPIRHLEAVISLSDGCVVKGHIYTTTLFVAGPEATRRFVLSLRQHGKEGESLESLVYVAEIVFDDNVSERPDVDGMISAYAVPDGGTPGVKDETALHTAEATDMDLIVMTRPGLFSVTGELDKSGATFTFQALPGNKNILALRSGATIRVSWPAIEFESLRDRVEDILADVKDSFNSRELLGAFHDKDEGAIYALLLLSRKIGATQHEQAGQPWRLEVWRWLCPKGDEERNLLAGRGLFFRGVAKSDGESVPSVIPVEAAWKARPTGNDGSIMSVSIRDVFGEEALPDGDK